jgi:hypothetical protein
MSDFEESVLERLKQLEDRIARLEAATTKQARPEPATRIQKEARAAGANLKTHWDKGKK